MMYGYYVSFVFFFKQKTAYEMRISDWSSDVCSSDLPESHRTPELEDLVEWLGETVRQTDSSLLDEWEALTDPDRIAEVIQGAPAPSRQLGRASCRERVCQYV